MRLEGYKETDLDGMHGDRASRRAVSGLWAQARARVPILGRARAHRTLAIDSLIHVSYSHVNIPYQSCKEATERPNVSSLRFFSPSFLVLSSAV